MSTLWHAQVLEVGGDTVKLSLRLVHPDAGPFPDEKPFVVRLLYEPSYELQDGKHVALGPLGEAISENEIYGEDRMNQIAGNFVAEVRISDVTHEGFTAEGAQAGVEARLIAEGVTRDSSAWAEKLDERWRAFWADLENMPTAVYTLRMTDPKWIAHLAQGQRWRSAAF